MGPVKTIRFGNTSIAIFEKDVTSNGKTFKSTSFAVQTSYKDPKTKEWKNSNFFKATDLPKLFLAVTEAMQYAYGKKEEVEVDTGDKNDVQF
jgi:hypothetical protein